MIHEVFPLIIYQEKVEGHDKFKENIDDLREYWFDGYKNESPENSGKIFVHLKYKSFFNSIKKNIDEYFSYLNVDYSHLSYHIIKSWVGCHFEDTPQLNPHTHNESNISFVYYLKSNSTSDKFVVSQRDNRNQAVGGLFETGQSNLITAYNKYNCNYYTISPKEGTILLFPSDTQHHTQKFTDRIGERIVIAGDIRVTLNNKKSDYHQGCTHPSQWLEI